MALYEGHGPNEWPVQWPASYYVCAMKVVAAAVVFLSCEPYPKSLDTFLTCNHEANPKKWTSVGLTLAQYAHTENLVPTQRLLENHQIWRYFQRFDQRNFHFWPKNFSSRKWTRVTFLDRQLLYKCPQRCLSVSSFIWEQRHRVQKVRISLCLRRFETTWATNAIFRPKTFSPQSWPQWHFMKVMDQKNDLCNDQLRSMYVRWKS